MMNMQTLRQGLKNMGQFIKGHPFDETETQMSVSIYEDVFIKYLAYAKPMHPNEFGALLRIKDQGGGKYLVDDVDFVKQRCSQVTFELDEMDLAMWRMRKDGEGEDLAEWSGIIHTHPTQAAFPSMPDLDQIIKLSRTQPILSLICGINQFDKTRAVFKAHYGRRDDDGQTSIMVNVPVKVLKREVEKDQPTYAVPLHENPYLLEVGAMQQTQVLGESRINMRAGYGQQLRSIQGQDLARMWDWADVRR